jgi:hypothetical protein
LEAFLPIPINTMRVFPIPEKPTMRSIGVGLKLHSAKERAQLLAEQAAFSGGAA